MNIMPVIRTAGAVLKAHAPQILLGTGLVGSVATVIVACNSTPKVETILEDYQEDKLTITDGQDYIDLENKCQQALKVAPDQYSQSDMDKDLSNFIIKKKAQLTVKMALDVAKAYLPAVIIGAASFAAIFGAFGILSKRLAMTAVSLVTVAQQFDEYRGRVVEEEGSIKDIHYMTGNEIVSEKSKDENGKVVKKQVLQIPDEKSEEKILGDPRTIILDSTSDWFTGNGDMDRYRIGQVLDTLNNQLISEGIVYVNDVRRAFMIPNCRDNGTKINNYDVKDGWKYGWVYLRDENCNYCGPEGGNKIDLGLDDPINARFMNREEQDAIIFRMNCVNIENLFPSY